MKISVILPVRNERENLETLVPRLCKVLRSLETPYEIIAVDDYSTDDSLKILKKLGKSCNLKTHKKQGEIGKGSSILEGISHATGDVIVTLDADLAFSPESIPLLLDELKDNDIVVANRIYVNGERFIKKILAKTFKFLFGKVLFGMDYDVQSGLKAFRKSVIKNLSLNPTKWSFDLEFLLKAVHAGYSVKGIPIPYGSRKKGHGKMNFVLAGLELVLMSARLWIFPAEPVLLPSRKIEEGQIAWKKTRYRPYTKLHLKYSALKRVTFGQMLVLLIILELVAIMFLANWHNAIVILISTISVVYFFDLIFNLFLIVTSLRKKSAMSFSEKELSVTRDWPTYTIICPLYREAEVLPQFIDAINKLDYPKNKIQVLLTLEADDKTSLEAVKQITLPSYFKVLVTPDTLPKTKPKACNYALLSATGEYVVVYDAEDRPDPDQLKKAILTFERLGENIVCLQAKLNFYNPEQNILTRLFTLEYSLWFDMILSGLHSINAPIPLGGTSNHFKRKYLNLVSGWDPFNVTEDCDLGIRLFKNGYHTKMLDSTTWEEANSHFFGWFRQRSRWIKGYIQTYLVHMRTPHEFITDWSNWHIITFQLIVGGKVLSMIINPALWVMTIIYFLFRPYVGTFIQSLYLTPIFYLAVVSLLFGNFMYFYYYMIAAAKKKDWGLVRYGFLIPFYWLMMSVSSWIAFVQIIVKPHFWEKTKHGLHLKKEEAKYLIAEVPVAKAEYPKIKIPLGTISKGSILVASLMIANVINFLFNAILGRFLTFEDFGLLTLINTLWLLAGLFVYSVQGVVNQRVAYLSSKINKAAGLHFLNSIANTILKVALVATLVFAVLSPFFASYFKTTVWPFFAFAPMILLGTFAALAQGFLQGNLFFISLSSINIFLVIAKLATALGFVAIGAKNLAFLAIPVSTGLAAILGIFLALNKIMSIKKNFTESPNFPIKYSFPKTFYLASVISGLSTNIFLTFDLILTKHFLSPKLAGEYAFLSLVGKMIYFGGSLLNSFMIPYVARDEGANRSSTKTFRLLFTGSLIIVTTAFILVGPLGAITIPMLFGAKAFAIVPYLTRYAATISLITLSNVFVLYHLAKQEYTFSATSIITATLMILGIFFYHNDIEEVVEVMLGISFINIVLMSALHVFQRNGRFFARNFIDLLGAFIPMPQPTISKDPSKKRILIFNWRDTKHSYAGGAETYIHELSRRWVKDGHRVTVFCGNDGNSPRDEFIDGVRIVRRGGFYFVYVWAILYYLAQFRGNYDIIIDSENGIPFFTPLFAEKEKKFLLIHHVHQEVFRKSLIPPLAWLAMFLEAKLMPFVYKNIQVITVSPSTKKAIIEHGLSTLEPFIVYNGVDIGKYKPGEKNKTPLVLYLGRLKYYKSLNIFIRSALHVLQKVPNAEFIIAGDGEERRGLERLAKKLSIYDQIKFLGKVSEKEKIDLFQRAWVFVNPSFMEGWGITSIEANACGTPVVASDVPGLRDSIRHKSTGFLVPHGDVKTFAENIINIIKKPAVRRTFAVSTVKWASQFEWRKSALKSLELF